MSNPIWIHNCAGKKVNLRDLQEDDIDSVEDIARTLSNLCRFGGRGLSFYSVAEHSVLVSRILDDQTNDPELAMQGLLHDAGEAYVQDIVSPVKYTLQDYLELEAQVERVLFEKFGLPYPMTSVVKEADIEALSIEKTMFFPDLELMYAAKNISDIPAHLEPQSLLPDDAYDFFIQEYHYLLDKIRIVNIE